MVECEERVCDPRKQQGFQSLVAVRMATWPTMGRRRGRGRVTPTMSLR